MPSWLFLNLPIRPNGVAMVESQGVRDIIGSRGTGAKEVFVGITVAVVHGSVSQIY